MSRSNPNEELINPCKHFFQWDGGDGKGFKIYDKETKKNVITPLPFKFLVLDRLTTITGYNEPEKIGYYSNEIRDIKNDMLTVRSKNGIEATGTYEEIKAKLSAKGASYCQSVYIMFFVGKEAVLGNIKMTGASLENWFSFCKENKIMEVGVQVKSANEKKKGKVVYYEPVFSVLDIKPATNELAIEIDKPLQEYLKAYLAKNKSTTETTAEHVKPESKLEIKAEDKPKIDPLPKDFDVDEKPIVGGGDDDENEPF